MWFYGWNESRDKDDSIVPVNNVDLYKLRCAIKKKNLILRNTWVWKDNKKYSTILEDLALMVYGSCVPGEWMFKSKWNRFWKIEILKFWNYKKINKITRIKSMIITKLFYIIFGSLKWSIQILLTREMLYIANVVVFVN